MRNTAEVGKVSDIESEDDLPDIPHILWALGRRGRYLVSLLLCFSYWVHAFFPLSHSRKTTTVT